MGLRIVSFCKVLPGFYNSCLQLFCLYQIKRIFNCVEIRGFTLLLQNTALINKLPASFNSFLGTVHL